MRGLIIGPGAGGVVVVAVAVAVGVAVAVAVGLAVAVAVGVAVAVAVAVAVGVAVAVAVGFGVAVATGWVVATGVGVGVATVAGGSTAGSVPVTSGFTSVDGVSVVAIGWTSSLLSLLERMTTNPTIPVPSSTSTAARAAITPVLERARSTGPPAYGGIMPGGGPYGAAPGGGPYGAAPAGGP